MSGAGGAAGAGTTVPGAPGPTDAAPSRGAGLVAALREVRRFARGVLGSDAYDRYLHHHRITGCTHPPLSERAFWRAKYAEQDANPGARCC